jgi:phage terminase large subunit
MSLAIQSQAYAKLKFPSLLEVRIERMKRLLNAGAGTLPQDPWFIPDKMLPLFSTMYTPTGDRVRFRVCYGGRGGARSWSFTRALLIRAIEKKTRIVCAREFQNSIEESVHELLSGQIITLGLEDLFDIKKREIRAYNGSDFVFAGLKTNITKMKSFEGADICYIEEAENISTKSWEVLIPTIRRPNSEIWAAFNPNLAKDPSYALFITNPPEDALVIKTTWRDNPWFPEPLKKARERLQRVDIDAYNHVWEGECRKNSAAQILRNKYVVASFTPGKDWNGPYFGADWGFSQDPTTLIKCWIHENKLYIEYEAYEIGCDIDKTPKLFDVVPGARLYTVRADNARPETISYMQRNGYPLMESVDKWPGSVEDGVAHIRSYDEVVIHTRCEHAQEEAMYYSFKIDKLSGDVLPDIEDKHNHIMDAIRYALSPMIKPGGASAFLEYMSEQLKTDEVAKQRAKENNPQHFIEYVKLMGAK